MPLARRIAEKIAAVEGAPVAVGELDVTLYRDDLRSQPTRRAHKTALPPGGIDRKVVVLVDDVLFSGRTIRAALDALADLGRPPPYASPCWSTAVTGSCRSVPTTSARTCPAPSPNASA